MIDPHVHLRDWEQSEKETIKHGVELGFAGNFSAFFDMPNTNPTLTDAETLKRRIEYGQNIVRKIDPKIFYGVYAGVTADLNQITEIVEFHKHNFPNCVGFKMYAGHSTGNMGITVDEAQQQIYKQLAKLNYTGVLAVHCELESLLMPDLWNPEHPETHSFARPIVAEIKSIENQIAFAKEYGFKGHLHICHISTKDGIDLVKKEKQNGMRISCGATAHHALLNTNAYHDFGIFAKMNPPLRNAENQKAIFNGLLNGDIDLVESDHAPHTVQDKHNGASGVPGFAGSLQLLQALRHNNCTTARLEELFGKNVNKIWKTNFEVNLPSDEQIAQILPQIKDGYGFNIFN